MPSTKADLLFHPIRLQILTIISSRHMTAGELAERIPDVPLSTLYRHINTLVEGGLLKITEETRIRGTIERTYTLASLPSLSPEDLQGMTVDECRQAFTIYLSTLMSAAERYLGNKQAEMPLNPLSDGVDISLGMLNLSDEEFQSFNRRILEMLAPLTGNPPAPGRKQRFFSYLFLPQE